MPHEKTFGKKLRRVCLILLILSPFLLLGWVHVWGILKVQAQVRAIRKAGDPATLQDLDALAQKIPLQEEAAAFYEEVFACLVFDDMDENMRYELPSIWRIESGKQAWPLPPEDRQWVRDVLDADYESLALLKNAPEIQGRVFDRLCVDWPQSFVSKRETLSQVVDLLLLQAIYAVDQNDATAVVESLWAAIQVADTLREELFAFSLGRRQRHIAHVVRALEWVSGVVEFSKDQQQQLDLRLSSIQWPMGLRNRLVNMRCAFRRVYHHPTPEILHDFGISRHITRTKRIPIHRGWIMAFKWSGLLRHSEATFLEQSEQIIDACLKWKPGQGMGIRRMVPNADRSWPITLTPVFLSLADPEYSTPLATDARLQVLRGILAARQYRQQTGQWPQTLDDLVPAYLKVIPSDPYTSTPIQYQSRQGGRAIFSVGEDLQVSQERYFKDDFLSRTSDDIVMWLEPPDEHPDREDNRF
jgi:hypothetical protein